MTSYGPNKFCQIIDSQSNFVKNTFDLVVITVPADGLAPSGARPSADAVMTKFRFLIYTGLALEMLVCENMEPGH